MFRFQEHRVIFILSCVLCKLGYVNNIPFDISPSAMFSFEGVKRKMVIMYLTSHDLTLNAAYKDLCNI